MWLKTIASVSHRSSTGNSSSVTTSRIIGSFSSSLTTSRIIGSFSPFIGLQLASSSIQRVHPSLPAVEKRQLIPQLRFYCVAFASQVQQKTGDRHYFRKEGVLNDIFPYKPLGIMSTHAFSGLSFDRSFDHEYQRQGFVQEALQTKWARFSLLHKSRALMERQGAQDMLSKPKSVLLWVSSDDLKQLQVMPQDNNDRFVLVGRKKLANLSPEERKAYTIPDEAASSDEDLYVFVVDVTSSDCSDDEILSDLSKPEKSSLSWTHMRNLLALHSDPSLVSRDSLAILGIGKAVLEWSKQSAFCGSCGSQTVAKDAGTKRTCAGCNATIYMRTDPVVIMIVVSPDGQRVALGRGPGYPANMYTTLSGFMEPGESIEDAVKREVREESGIEVGDVQYHSSQPWPIGRGNSNQLMIGCFAHAKFDDLNFDKEEMEDVRWFTVDEVSKMLREPFGSPTGLHVPGPFAIAHHLIKGWLQSTQGLSAL